MYYHLVGIKEKDGQQQQLDLLIGGGDLSLVKEFLEHWGVVVVSLEEYEQQPQEFGNIQVLLSFKEQKFTIILKGTSLKEPLYFLFSLELIPEEINFISNPLPKEQIASLIKKVAADHEKQYIEREKEQQRLAQKEQRKFENKDVKEALKVINNNIDRIDQLLFIGKGVLSSDEMRKLTDISNELKKIRLGTNFNRMAQLLLEAQRYISVAEEKVLKVLDDKKFFIDRNSVVTNIDVISEYNALISAQEKSVLKKPLTNTESLYLIGRSGTIFSKFFLKDFIHAFSSFGMLLPNIISLAEYFVSVLIVVIVFMWLFLSLSQGSSDLLYYLPIFGFLGILLYVYNLYTFKRVNLQVIALIVLIICYFGGISLIKNTFAF